MSFKSLEPGTILNGRYEIKRKINSGGMGAVYEALDRRFDGISCAVKEMLSSPDDEKEDREYMIGRFKEEAGLLYKLRHPNLPVVKDYFVENERYYLVMDYIEGENLDRVISGYPGGMPEETAIEWSIQVLDALDFLHKQDPPVVYRDLKPANIMLKSSDKKIILVDFGLARPVKEDSKTIKTAAGTPSYAPMEVFQGNPTPRSDIYSLGATMYHMLTGEKPSGIFSFQPLKQVRPNISVELSSAVMKALEMKADNRYESARKMKETLENLSHSPAEAPISLINSHEAKTILPHPTSPIPGPPSEKKGKKNFWILAGVITASLLIIIFFIIAGGGILGAGLLLYNQNNKVSPTPFPTAIIKKPSPDPTKKPEPTEKPEAIENYIEQQEGEKKIDSIYVRNETDEKIKLLLYYSIDGRWRMEGWFGIEAGTEIYAFDTDNQIFYYYADSENFTWHGSDKIEGSIKEKYDGKEYYMAPYSTDEEFGDYYLTFD